MPRSWGDERPVDDGGGGSGEFRSASQRDADRILYSSAFRRLSSVTQVIARRDEFVLHDRLTHSLKVAQVAHRLTQDLGRELRRKHEPGLAERLDPDAAYMAGLAHDLGHPPYGHAAENELQKVLEARVDRLGRQLAPSTRSLLKDSFEGNAQTFRIVTKLAFRKRPSDDRPNEEGLNLTWRSLAAVLKYPWGHGGNERIPRKWGAYDSEWDYLKEARRRANAEGLWFGRSLDAQIMDWADDIAYAVHDVEDFCKAGLIPLDRLFHDTAGEWSNLLQDSLRARLKKGWEERNPQPAAWDDQTFDRVCRDVVSTFPEQPFYGRRDDRFALHTFSSQNTKILSEEVSIDSREGLVIPFQAWVRAELLKKLTKVYVIERPAVAAMQAGQRRIVRELFFDLQDMVKETRGERPARRPAELPERLQDYLEIAMNEEARDDYGEDEKLARATVDYIASLTDQQAALLHARMTGEPTGAGDFYWLSV